jgi:hypothetical protein
MSTRGRPGRGPPCDDVIVSRFSLLCADFPPIRISRVAVSAVGVVGSHYAGALIARDCGDAGPEIDRRFEFLVSHDRALVLEAARSLLSKLIPLN